MTDERKGIESASKTDAHIRCLGAPALIKKLGFKDDSNKTWATMGDNVHQVLAHQKPIETLSESEMVTAYKCMNEEAYLIDKHGFHDAEKTVRECEGIGDNGRLWITDWDAQPDPKQVCSCRIDLFLQKKSHFLMIDYKTGWLAPVPIRKNWQIRTMGIILAEHEPELKTLTAALVHPHHPDFNMLSQEVTYSRAELEMAKKELFHWLNLMTEDATRTPNPISCQFCPAKSVCAEYQSEVGHLLNVNGEIGVRPRWEMMSPTERGERLTKFKMAEYLIEAEREFYKKMLAQDVDYVDGWKLKSGGYTTSYVDFEAEKLVAKQYGEECVAASRQFSVTLLKDYVFSKGLAKTKKKAEEIVKNLLEPIAQKKPKKPSLVESD